MQNQRRALKTYGGRNGRKLSSRQLRLIETLLPKVEIKLDPTRPFDPLQLFTPRSEMWLEIGFGGGEHVSGQARKNPDIGLLASEVFAEGIAKLLGQIETDDLQNIRIWPKDGRDLVAGLQRHSIDRAFILFPDPWPKSKHHKRRLIQPPFLDALARNMKPGGRVRFATDVRSYADQALERFLHHPAYQWTAKRADDWQSPPSDHIQTRYEAKRLGDIRPVFYDFEIKSAN
ncbi:MAG: tRNA (guanosine(46)-N7)-methyltransferase TrmB [Pseudomonadota bacterium]